MTKIIEESEDLSLNRIATVQTIRSEEVLINVDNAVCGIAELFSNLDNEKRFGWVLSAGWYEEQLSRLRELAYGLDQ